MHTTPAGKVYIGQTCCKDPNRRWRNGKGYTTCKLFYRSIEKYGWNNIEHKILHTGLTKEKADIMEKMYIQFFKRKNISLNITDGGEGTTGHHLSEEHRRKLSEANKGKHLSEETKRKLSETNKGRVLTEETKKKMSESNKGHIVSSETRRKISEGMKGKFQTAETIRKRSEALKGKPHSPEHIKNLTASLKGKQRKRSIWLNEFSQEVEMSDCQVKRFHKNWIKVRSL